MNGVEGREYLVYEGGAPGTPLPFLPNDRCQRRKVAHTLVPPHLSTETMQETPSVGIPSCHCILGNSVVDYKVIVRYELACFLALASSYSFFDA